MIVTQRFSVPMRIWVLDAGFDDCLPTVHNSILSLSFESSLSQRSTIHKESDEEARDPEAAGAMGSNAKIANSPR